MEVTRARVFFCLYSHVCFFFASPGAARGRAGKSFSLKDGTTSAIHQDPIGGLTWRVVDE